MQRRDAPGRDGGSLAARVSPGQGLRFNPACAYAETTNEAGRLLTKHRPMFVSATASITTCSIVLQLTMCVGP